MPRTKHETETENESAASSQLAPGTHVEQRKIMGRWYNCVVDDETGDIIDRSTSTLGERFAKAEVMPEMPAQRYAREQEEAQLRNRKLRQQQDEETSLEDLTRDDEDAQAGNEEALTSASEAETVDFPEDRE